MGHGSPVDPQSLYLLRRVAASQKEFLSSVNKILFTTVLKRRRLCENGLDGKHVISFFHFLGLIISATNISAPFSLPTYLYFTCRETMVKTQCFDQGSRGDDGITVIIILLPV